jgi:hypothetical protein
METHYARCRDEYLIVHFVPVGWWAWGVWRESEFCNTYAIVWVLLDPQCSEELQVREKYPFLIRLRLLGM